MSVEGVAGILLISPDAKKLRDFYVDVLQLPLEDEVHDDVPLHYACEFGFTHFAIHPADDWPGKATRDAQSPVILLNSNDVSTLADRLRAAGTDPNGPYDHGFAYVVSFRDPDGNHVEILQAKK